MWNDESIHNCTVKCRDENYIFVNERSEFFKLISSNVCISFLLAQVATFWSTYGWKDHIDPLQYITALLSSTLWLVYEILKLEPWAVISFKVFTVAVEVSSMLVQKLQLIFQLMTGWANKFSLIWIIPSFKNYLGLLHLVIDDRCESVSSLFWPMW